MRNMIKQLILPFFLFLMLLVLAGCGGDVELMTSGLTKSGLPANQAAAFAEKMSKSVKKGPYNYMAKLMDAGISEKDAVNKTRRKYGAEFKQAMQEAREETVQE